MTALKAEWIRLEEERRYSGTTEAAVARAFEEGLNEALGEGYMPASLTWSDDADEPTLTVTYEYAPARAPRPL